MRLSIGMAAALALTVMACGPSQNARSILPSTSEPTQVETRAFEVIGYSARTTNEREMSQQNGIIGPLWGKFAPVRDTVPNIVDAQSAYAVYSNYESDYKGAYDFTVGRSVRHAQTIPDGMHAVHVPGGKHLVFPAQGTTPHDVQAVWVRIWHYFAEHTAIARAYTTDYEQHSPTGVSVFIAIR